MQWEIHCNVKEFTLNTKKNTKNFSTLKEKPFNYYTFKWGTSILPGKIYHVNLQR